MGTLGNGNGDWSYDGQRDGLPGLPPEWGTIVIPDDPSELAAEAEEVRRELRHENRRQRWRRRLGLSTGADSDEPSVGLPLLIMAIAVVATLTSLFAVAWPRPTQPPAAPPAALRSSNASELPDIRLTDYRGESVRLLDKTPAVLLFIDGCECRAFIIEVAQAAGPRINILPVTQAVRLVGEANLPATVRHLTDPTDALLTRFQLASPAGGAAAVALVTKAGKVVRVLPSAHSVNEFRTELAALV